MPLQASVFDEHVVGRMLEFATPATPWHRRLWRSGPLLTAGELLDVAGESNIGVGARRELQAEFLHSLRGDPGLGSYAQAVRNVLPKDARDFVRESHAWHALDTGVRSARPGYLRRWADYLRAGSPDPTPEFVARRLASHLLDHGWSTTHLHRWMTYRVRHRADMVTLADILEEAADDLGGEPRSFEFCAPLARTPALPRPTPDGWLTGHEVAEWRKQHVPSADPLRQYGGVVLRVSALDAYSAAELVRAQLTALTTRFAVGGRRELQFLPEIWMRGRPEAFPLAGSPRRVEVHAFERLDRLFDERVPARLSSALALIEPLDRGAPSAAISGAWAAMESLMTGPADGAASVAAERMALVVASSFVRSELTVLAWAHARDSADALALEINEFDDNRDKADALERGLAGRARLQLNRETDIRAAERLEKVRASLGEGVGRVQRVLQRAFVRLYRHRNLMLHAGRIDAVGTDSALRLAAPLVGAGLDRVAQAMLERNTPPLELAAKARVRLATLRPATSGQGSGVVDLLE